MRKKLTLGHLAITIILLILAVLCFYPLWYSFIWSISDKAMVDAGRVWIWPLGITTTSYQKILEDQVFFNSIWVSVKRVLVGCSLQMLMTVVTAYPLSVPERKFPPQKYLKWFFLANMLFSGGLIPSYMLMRQYGLMNSFWVMILPGAVPLWNVILLVNFYRAVPYALSENATIDGASPLSILWNIMIPLCIPSLACLFLFSFVGHWNSYFDGMLYINDVSKQPLQTYIYQLNIRIDYQQMSSEEIIALSKTSDKTLNAAKVIVALVPILCIYPFIQKYFTTGMTLGAVKG